MSLRMTEAEFAALKAGRESTKEPARENKYSNKRIEVDGIKFHSKREASRYHELKIMEKAGLISGLELQVPFRFDLNNIKIGKFIADFTYLENDALVVEDCKNPHLRKEMYYRLKTRLMRAFFGIEIRET